MRDREAWQGWLLVAAWLLAVGVVFRLLVAPPWGDPGPVTIPTVMSGR